MSISINTRLGAGRRCRRAAMLCAAVVLSSAATAGGANAAVKHDVNGDRLADVAFTDYVDSIDSPGATVVFGARDRVAPASRADPGQRGFRITGDDETLTGAEVIGDVNGDGLADVLAATTGEAFVIYGRRTPAPVKLVSSEFAKGVVGTRFYLPYDNIRGAGDVNGDGLADLVSVAGGERAFADIRLGSRSKPLSKGFEVRAGGRVERVINPTVAPAGDSNGDGRDDIAIAVADPNGRRDGFDVEEMVFLVWGKRDRRSVTLTQGRSTSSARVRVGRRPGGFAISHARRNCWCQTMQLDPAGDLNGDGRADLGITWMDPFVDSRSRTDVIFGRGKSTPVVITGTSRRSSAGATVPDIEWSQPFASIGDLDGDRRDDLLLAVDHDGSVKNPRDGLQLLSGKRARGRVALKAPATPLIGANANILTQVLAAGDMDGDGRRDLLVGYSPTDLSDVSFAIVYGAAPLAPVDLTKPGRAATMLPPS